MTAAKTDCAAMADADIDAQLEGLDLGEVVVHLVWDDQESVDDWPELEGRVGDALCGFVFTRSNAVEDVQAIVEGAKDCLTCQWVYIQMRLEVEV